MPGSTDLLVRILGDTSSLNRALNDTNSKLGKFGSVAKAAAGAFVAGFAADQVVDFLGDATKAAEEDKKSQALLANQLRETNKATDAQIAKVEDSINALSRQTGVADDKLRPAFAALARSTGDTEEAQRELALAMDIAAGRGVDLETVTAALEKAHNGNIGALSRLGVATKDAEGNTLSLEQAMAKAADTYAGAAEAAVTPSERMSVAWGELKEQVGTVLLPVLEKLSTWAAETLLPAMQNAITWIQTNWPTFEHAFQTTWAIVGPILEDIGTAIKTTVAVAMTVIQPLIDLLHGDWGKAWEDFRDRISDVWDGITSLIGRQKDIILGLIGGMVSALKSAVNAFIRLWNALDFTMPKVHVPGTNIDIGGFTIGLPDIPLLAKGGIVNRPTLAVVGERGPEAVVPLGSGGMGQTFHIQQVVVNGVQSPQQFMDALVKWARTSGRAPAEVRAAFAA